LLTSFSIMLNNKPASTTADGDCRHAMHDEAT
jgi:hypothetical protein